MNSIRLILYYILTIYSYIMLVRVLLSWFPNIDRYNPIVKFLYDVTEPVLQPIRNALRNVTPGGLPIDFSPLIVFLIISVLIRFL